MARSANSTGTNSGSITDIGADRSRDTGSFNGSSDETEEISLQSSSEEVEKTSSVENPTVILEAIDVEQPKRRRGRPRKLTSSESDVPSVTQNKRAQFYITILRDTWMDIHGFAGNIVDEELKWTIEESTRFAEAAYEVCRARNWLRFLERMTEARLIVIVLSIETEKVKKVLAKQQPKNQEQLQSPPPMIRRAGSQDVIPPMNNGSGTPSYVPAPRFIPQQ